MIKILVFIAGAVVVLYLLMVTFTPKVPPSLPVASAALSSPDSVIGGPDLSASFIDTILSNAGSPAQGLGATLVQLSTQYQIKDSFALAVFHHESSYGRYGVAQVTHSWGNIKCTSGYPCIDKFRAYSSFAQGARDFYQLIATVYVAYGRKTLATIFPVYAPSSENNVDAYITAVRADMQQWEGGNDG